MEKLLAKAAWMVELIFISSDFRLTVTQGSESMIHKIH